ncbi:MAG: putative lipoprotein [Parcubacteria group bacterium Licking1014_17]|nr:MAG: putative lipoprotein [Parcubacteria group bacterium Licking1014_17]
MKKILAYSSIPILIALAVFLFFQKNKIEIGNQTGLLTPLPSKFTGNLKPGPLSGVNCENAGARPVAVMIPSDPEAMPLSGISEADMVFEMPVTDGGVTRMMAVFQCNQPKEIGSIRSSRVDFIPLALGLGAIYSHWGGEATALEELNSSVIDNIDGLKYDGTVYYRKSERPRPHNGFTSFKSLLNKAKELDYSLDNPIIGYKHDSKAVSKGDQSPPMIYADDFAVKWIYDSAKNTYKRQRVGIFETDFNNSKQVEAANVVIMNTSWLPVNKDYIRVSTTGSGQATIYKNGEAIAGTWEKSGDKGKLSFYDNIHKEIEFTPGPIWVEIKI